MSDQDLVKAHDQLARTTYVGTKHYLVELTRRDQERLLSRMVEAAEAQEAHAATMARYLAEVADLIGTGSEQNAEMVHLTRRMFWLTAASVGAAIVSVIVAIVVAIA